MKRSTNIKRISLYLVTFLLAGLWVLVALDKFWNLGEFYSTLLKQPFPNWWAGILFWLLPVLELLAAILLVYPSNAKLNYAGMWLSFVLMLGFTLYIAFGVMGFYSKQPCGCGSVIKNLTWPEHLLFNAFFLIVSIVGIWLRRSKKTETTDKPESGKNSRFSAFNYASQNEVSSPQLKAIRNKLKFALFRR